MHVLVEQLSRIDSEYPLKRKILFCSDLVFGQELLTSLAVKQGSWVGWEPLTLRGLALRMTRHALASSKRFMASHVECTALAENAIDKVVSELHPLIAELATDAGMRSAIVGAVRELRNGGVSAGALRGKRGEFNASLAAVLDAYTALLEDEKLADDAWLLEQALAVFDQEFRYAAGDAVAFIAPEPTATGLSGKLLDKVKSAGAHELTGTPEPLPPAGTRFMRADTAASELLAVLRDAAQHNARFDEVEIACTNTDLYGVELDALCTQAGIPATMLRGVPLFATRPGRTVSRWLEWLESGLDSDVIVRALEAGDFVLNGHDGATLAFLLKRARAGWGRAAVATAAVRLRRIAEQNEMEKTDARAETAVAALLETLLEITPAVRDATDDIEPAIRVSEIARSVIALLEFSDTHDGAPVSYLVEADVPQGAADAPPSTPDRHTVIRVRNHLRAVVDRVHTTLPAIAAISAVRAQLARIRTWTGSAPERRRNRAIGGYLYLTDIAHAGTTGRKYRYIVGLDSANCTPREQYSPLLPDSVREQFVGALRISRDARRIRTEEIQRAIAASNAAPVLVYSEGGSTGGAGDASHVLLEAWRSVHNNPGATYADMRSDIGVIQGAAPAAADTAVTERGVWLQLLESSLDAGLQDLTPLVFEMRPHVRRGLRAAREIAEALEPTKRHGYLPEVTSFDIRNGAAISPSSLEAFGACPLRWFYRDGIKVRLPDAPHLEPGEWLDARDRGSMLHEVFAAIIKARLHETHAVPVGSAVHAAERERADAEALHIMERIADNWKRRVPPPGDQAFTVALNALREDIKVFLTQERASWLAERFEMLESERAFGSGDDNAALPLPDGTTVSVKGRIDRIDSVGDALRIIDYKTGRAFEVKARDPFDGGRRLQLPLYAFAASTLYNKNVAKAEYRFPTVRGEGVAREFSALDATQLSAKVGIMAAEIASGHFLPTYDSNDCRYCDYAAVCRVSVDAFGNAHSPRAAWGKEHKSETEYQPMNELRGRTK